MKELKAIGLGGEHGVQTDTALFELTSGQSLQDGEQVKFYDWRRREQRVATVGLSEAWQRGKFCTLA